MRSREGSQASGPGIMSSTHSSKPSTISQSTIRGSRHSVLLAPSKDVTSKSSHTFSSSSLTFSATTTIPDTCTEENCIHKGWLSIKAKGKLGVMKKRWCMLDSENLHIYPSEGTEKRKAVISSLWRYEFIVVKNNTFELDGRSEKLKSYTLKVDEIEKAAAWQHHLQNAVERRGQNAIKTIEQRLAFAQIPPEDLIINDTTLGRGGTGLVMRGKWQRTTDVAVKMLRDMPEFVSTEELERFYREIETLSQLRHPAVVIMYGYCRKNDTICLVTEYIEGGNLSQAIVNPEIELGLSQIVDMLVSIAGGMVFLHKKGIIHRDLKPANVLIESLERGIVKVCDFGLSGVINVADGNIYGTPAYAAPELPDLNHTERVDVFSFALIIWSMISRKTPWKEEKFGGDIQEKVLRGERPPLPEDNLLSDLIAKCWRQDPMERPTFNEIHGELSTMAVTLKSIYRSGQGSVKAKPSPSTQRPSISGSQLNTSKGTSYMVWSMVEGSIREPSEASFAAEERIVSAFGDQQSVPWEQFVQVLEDQLKSNRMSIERMKWCLVQGNGRVSVAHWRKFIKWFQPLIEEKGEGYTVQDIADIVGHDWFHGMQSADQAKSVLTKMRWDRGWLLRFSGSAGYYTLSALFDKAVYHWRIACVQNRGKVTFTLEKNVFPSLDALILHYQTNTLPEPSPSDKRAEGYQLGEFCNRMFGSEYIDGPHYVSTEGV